MTVPGQGKEAPTNWILILANLQTGEGLYQNASCDRPGTLFRASSYDQTYFLEHSEMMKTCVIGDILFRFRRKSYAPALEQALAIDSPVIRAASDTARNLQGTVVEALKVANYQVAATNSMLLRDAIEKQFGQKAAEPFRILAIDIAASAVATPEPLTFDPPQKAYVLGPDSVRLIADFQKQKGLKSTGVLTWSTASKLPNMGVVEIGETVSPVR